MSSLFHFDGRGLFKACCKTLVTLLPTFRPSLSHGLVIRLSLLRDREPSRPSKWVNRTWIWISMEVQKKQPYVWWGFLLYSVAHTLFQRIFGLNMWLLRRTWIIIVRNRRYLQHAVKSSFNIFNIYFSICRLVFRGPLRVLQLIWWARIGFGRGENLFLGKARALRPTMDAARVC